MRSLIILEVEHTPDTDDIQHLVELLSEVRSDGTQWLNNFGFDIGISDYTVRVDIPPYLTANNVNAVIEAGRGH